MTKSWVNGADDDRVVEDDGIINRLHHPDAKCNRMRSALRNKLCLFIHNGERPTTPFVSYNHVVVFDDWSHWMNVRPFDTFNIRVGLNAHRTLSR